MPPAPNIKDADQENKWHNQKSKETRIHEDQWRVLDRGQVFLCLELVALIQSRNRIIGFNLFTLPNDFSVFVGKNTGAAARGGHAVFFG